MLLFAQNRRTKRAGYSQSLSQEIPKAHQALDTTVFARSREAAFVVRAASGTIEASNKAAERLFGYASADMAGQAATMLCHDSRSSRNLSNGIDQVGARGGVVATQCLMSSRGDSPFPARNRIIALGAPGHANTVLWLVRRADASKVAARNEILERDLFRIGASRELAVDRWLPFLERFSREFEWDYAEVWAPRFERLTHIAWWSPQDSLNIDRFTGITRSIGFRPGEGLPGRVWRSDVTEWLSNVSETPSSVFRRNFIARSTGLTTFFAAPVRCAGRVTHILVFANRSSRRPDPDIMALTQEGCHAIGQLVADDIPEDDSP